MRARHDFQLPGFLRARNGRHVRAVLGVDVAAALVAEAVIHARGAILIGARVDRGGPGKRVPAEAARRRGHQIDEAGAAQRRHRVRPLARTFEDVAARIDRALDVAGLARDADFVFHLVVVRLELVEAERPVFDRRSLRHARRAVAPGGLAHDLEVPRVEPPALRPVMQRGAADGVHHRVAAGARGRRGRVDAMGRHLLLRLLHRLRPVADVVADFIRREVALGEPRARLEADHIEARQRQRQHRHAAGRAQADDDDVGVLQPSGHDALRVLRPSPCSRSALAPS